MAVPDIIKPSVLKLSDDQATVFNRMYRQHSRSLFIAYILWALLGLHYVYLKKYGTAFIFWATFGGLLLWWAIDIFRIPGMVRQENSSVTLNLLSKIKNI